MSAECNVTIGVDVVSLGSEVNVRSRFSTVNIPQAKDSGYGTIAAPATMEAIVLGQVAHSVVDALYVKSIDNTIYVSPTTLVSTGALIKLEAGEGCVFRPYNPSSVLSVGIVCSTAEAKYEYLCVGQSS